jgi:hypothetical protein
MNTSTARARLVRMIQVTVDPTLDTSEVDDLMTIAEVYGPDGVTVIDYNLNRAAATGWEWKAAKAAGDFAFTDRTGTYNRQQVYDQCMRMAAVYGGGPSRANESATPSRTLRSARVVTDATVRDAAV